MPTHGTEQNPHNLPGLPGYSPRRPGRGARPQPRARNKAGRTNTSAVKTKSDMMAENIMPSIKNMGY